MSRPATRSAERKKQEAADTFVDIVEEHLSRLPADEQARRLSELEEYLKQANAGAPAGDGTPSKR